MSFELNEVAGDTQSYWDTNRWVDVYTGRFQVITSGFQQMIDNDYLT